MNIILLFLIGISLSMDTFSLALSLGTFNVTKKKCVLFSLIVGIFHFIMPIIGNFLGKSIDRFFIVDPDKLLFIIFLFIAIEMLVELCSKENKKYDFSFFNMIIYAFSVSIDSLTVGIGINNITMYPIMGSIIFSIISFSFTMLGMLIGRFSFKKLGHISKVVGFIIIFILAIFNLIK